MEQNAVLIAKKSERVFHQLYEKIFSFLDFPSLMQSLTVSKDFYHLLNNYFKNFLMNNNLIKGQDFKTDKSDEDHYLKLFRSFYSREVLVAQLGSVKNSYSELQLVRYPRCSTYGVKDFSMGAKFTVFHLYNDDIIFLKSDEYLNPLFNMKNINRKNIRKNVSKFFTRARDLFYLTTTGHLHVIFYSSETHSHELNEGILDLSINKPLKDIGVSYSLAVLLFSVPENKEQKGSQNPKSNIVQDIRCLDLQNLTPEEFNSPAKMRKMEGLDDQEIVSFCVGNPAAYFLTSKYRVFECDFAAMNNEKFLAAPYEHFNNRNIKKLWSGLNTFFALEQNEIESIENWDQKEILQWAGVSKDFNEYLNIIKYENITGKDLLEADKAFLQDRLGMMRDDLQVKFLNEIEKVRDKTYKKPKLFGWGNNGFGQLALYTGSVMINRPYGITLPEFEKNDELVHVECGWKTTMLFTKKGNVWATEVPVKKVAPKEEEEAPPKPAHGKKSKRKESTEITQEKVSEKGHTRWLNLTPTCEKLKDGRKYKIIKISLSKDHFAALGASLGRKKGKGQHQQEEEEEKAPTIKFKGADQIYNRILWDKSLNRDEFAVGYEDRFLGILEIPFNEFSLKTDIPLHRIKFFKRNRELVWDRSSKTNTI